MGVLRLCLVCAGVVIPAFAQPAQAQYFGRNKVEYADFDFHVLTTEHFDIYYYEREERPARIAAQLAERWYARIARVLRHELDRRQPLVVYGSQAEFAQTNVVSGLVPDSVGGVTESLRRRIVMPFAPTMAETERVLGHELVHAFQFDIARRYGGGTGQPLWFVEGMAEYLARGTADDEAGLWLRDVVRGRTTARRRVRLCRWRVGMVRRAALRLCPGRALRVPSGQALRVPSGQAHERHKQHRRWHQAECRRSAVRDRGDSRPAPGPGGNLTSDSGWGSRINSQRPIPNSQATTNSQLPIIHQTEFEGFGSWALGVTWKLGVGNWELTHYGQIVPNSNPRFRSSGINRSTVSTA